MLKFFFLIILFYFLKEKKVPKILSWLEASSYKRSNKDCRNSKGMCLNFKQ